MAILDLDYLQQVSQLLSLLLLIDLYARNQSPAPCLRFSDVLLFASHRDRTPTTGLLFR